MLKWQIVVVYIARVVYNVPMEKDIKKVDKGIKFPWFYYVLFMILCFAGRLYFNGKAIKSKAFKEAVKKGPVLVMCNHGSAFDFAFFTPPFVGKKIAFVVAENMLYSTPFLAKIIRAAKEITKKQYIADLGCVRKMKKYMDAGISVALCPEGQVASCGKTGIVPKANGKLMKFLGYPVAVCLTHGAGLSRPKWGYTARRGKVVTKCDILYTAEQTKELSPDELYEGLVQALQFNEHKYQIENDLVFKGKRRAEGLERILYRCPKCGKEFTIKTEDNNLTCTACGNAIEYAKNGKLIAIGEGSVAPERVDLWYDQEREAVKAMVEQEDFMLTNECALFIEKPEVYNYRFVTTGVVTLDKEKITFVSNMDNRPTKMVTEYGVGKFEFKLDMDGELEPVEEEFKNIVFNIRNNESCAFNPGKSLELYDLEHSYRIVFTKEDASTQYALAVEELYKSRKNK